MSATRQGTDKGITERLFQNTMLTMLIAELSGALTAIIDGVITGRFLGSTALAAHGIGTPYFSIASIISGILMVGSTALCTRAIGKGDEKETGRIFSMTLFLSIALSVLLALGGSVFAGSLASLFGAKPSSPELHAATTAYLKGIFPGAPGFILFVFLTPLLQLDGDSFRPKLASAVCAVVDVAGDLLNVMVFHGGMFGMGLASSLSHYAALIVVLSHFLGKKSLFRFSFDSLQFDMIPSLTRDGMPRAVCMFCRGLLPILMNSLVLSIAGAEGVAALSAENSSSFVVGALGWGIGGAVLIMGGMMVGENDVRGLVTVMKTALKDILVLVTCMAAAVSAAAPLIAGLFIPSGGDAYTMAITAIRCYALSLPFLAFNVSCANYFQSIQRLKSANAVNICIEFGCTAAFALLLSPRLGILGVWLAFPVGEMTLCLIIILSAVFKKDRNRDGLAAYMLLPPDFGVADEDLLESSVKTVEEAVASSTEVDVFCRERGISKKEAYRLSLCTEELARNVIEHGFSDGKPHHLDIRVFIKDGKPVLRMRDDCILFDLREKAENWSYDPEHPEKNIGIRLVMSTAKDIAYTSTMNTNNLIITV